MHYPLLQERESPNFLLLCSPTKMPSKPNNSPLPWPKQPPNLPPILSQKPQPPIKPRSSKPQAHAQASKTLRLQPSLPNQPERKQTLPPSPKHYLHSCLGYFLANSPFNFGYVSFQNDPKSLVTCNGRRFGPRISTVTSTFPSPIRGVFSNPYNS